MVIHRSHRDRSWWQRQTAPRRAEIVGLVLIALTMGIAVKTTLLAVNYLGVEDPHDVVAFLVAWGVIGTGCWIFDTYSNELILLARQL